MRIAKAITVCLFFTACSADLPHEAPFDPDAPFEKQAKASLSGTIRLEGETDFSQVTLDLQNAERTYNVDTAADGAVSLTGIVPGEYTLKIRTRYFQPVEETLTIEMGATIDLGTRTLAPLRSRVLGSAMAEKLTGSELVTRGGVALTLRKTASVRAAVAKGPKFFAAAGAERALLFSTLSGSDGDFAFPDVPAGGYELSAATDEAEERVVGTVTVTGEGDVTVDPIVLRPLTGYFEILGSANGVPSSTYTSVAAVNLQLQQSNAVQVKVAVSTDGTTTGCDLTNATAEALPSNTLRPLTFTSEGKKLVCVSYVDADGKETAPIYGSITYDATPPTLPSVAINGGAAVVSSNLVTLSLSAVDTLSGVAVHKVHAVNDFSAVSPKPYQPTDVYSLTPAGDGLKTVWVIFGDHAGNYSSPVSASALLDTTPPAVSGGVTPAKLDGTPLTSGDTIAESRIKITSTVSEATPVLEMQITTTGSYAGQSWVPYDPAKTIDLPSGASTISVRVRDGAGHVVDLVTAFTLTTDTTPPTGTLVIGPTAVTDPAITVQATGSIDAVAVELAFDPGFVTSLGNFVPGPIAVTLPVGDGTKAVYGRFFDAAGNTSALVGDTVTLDTTPPQILSYTLSQASPTKDNPVTVNYSAAGAAELRITEGADCGGAREPVGSGTKSFSVSAAEGNKEIRLQFFDAAGNASECAVRTVYYDPNPPVVGALQINFGQAATSSNVVMLSFPGVAGATKVMVSEDAGFAGADWQSYSATKTFTLSAGNGVKTVYAKVADDAGHVVNLTQQTITLDTTPPTSPSVYAAVDVTSQTSVTLFLAAGLVSEMWITQDDPNFTTGGWETYSGTKVVTLTGADGTKTLYAKFKKSTGVETAVVSDSVILDRAAPTLPSVRVDGNVTVVSSASLVLNLSAVDAASGLATYKINTVNDFTAVSAEPFQSNVLYGLSGPDGSKTVWVTIGDKAGQYSAPVSTTVLLDTADPVVNSAVVQTTGGTPLTTGATVADARVVLTTNVSDLSALQMQISTSGSFAGAIWEQYSQSKTIDLPAGASALSVRVRDAAGHITDLITSFSITVDTAPPTSPSLVISGKLAGAVSTTTVSVTLSVAGDAVDAEVAYDPGFVTSLGSFAPNATHNVPLLAGDGSKSLYVRFFDAAGNESALAGDTVILDTTPPIASFTIAQASPTKTSPLTLNYTQAGATQLRVAEDTVCGGALEAVGSGTRALTVSASEGLKEVRMQFFDAVGNAGPCLAQSVYYDPNPPIVGALAINYGQAATSGNVVTLSFPGVSGATKVIVSEDAGFAGADWQSFSATKTFTLSAGNGVKTVYAKVADDAGNVVNLPAASITLDTTPPTSPSIFAAYDVTSQTAVTLFLSAGLVSDMWITQDDPTFSTGGWETYSGTKVFTLSGIDGTKTIYAKFKKSGGVETSTVSDTVVLDRTAPTLPSVSINGGAAVVTASIVTLNLSAVDAASGLATYKVNITNDFSAVSPKPYQPTDVFTFAAGDGPKTVWVTFGDRAGLYSAPVSATVLIDTTAPAVGGAVTVSKLDGTPLTAGSTVSDTRILLNSSVADLSSLEMQITANGSYSGVAWVPYEPAKVVDLTSGTPTISARVRDRAGLITEILTAFTLTVDNTAPILTLSRTSAATTNDLVVALSLSATESGQAQVSEDPAFVGALWFPTGNTTFTLPAGDRLRTLYARARDAAGNLSITKQVTVLLDTSAPMGASVTVNGGAGYTQTAAVTLSITGNGAAELQVSENADFAGATWVAFSTTYAYAITGGEGAVTVYLRLRDEAGNTTIGLSDGIMFDAQAPTGASIAIAEQPKTRQSFVTLTLSAVGAAELTLADDASFAGRPWQPVTATTQWTLQPGDGTKTVYVKYRDAAGNESAAASASTILDTTPPVAGSLMLNGGAAITNSTTVAYAVSATDALSEPLEMQVSGEPGFGGAAWTAYAATGNKTIAAGDGVRSLYVRFRDAVGNVSLAASGSFILDQTGPQIASFVVNEGRVYATTDVLVDFQVGNWAAGDMLQVATAADFSGAAEYPSNAGVNRVNYTLSGADGPKTVYARAKDTLGNFGPAWSSAVTLDTQPPTVSGPKAMVLASDADFTTTRFVNLDLNVAGATEMLVWNTGQLLYATWEPFQASTVWALPFGDGVHTVQARFRDAARNVIEGYSDIITLDTSAPTSPSVMINAGGAYIVSENVALTLSAAAATSMQLSGDGVFDTEPLTPYDTFANWSFSADEGQKVVYARFCDDAGNCSQVVSASALLDKTLPTGAIAVNQGAARTNVSTVTLNLTAGDAVSGLQGIKLANSLAALATTDVVTYEATKIWTLAAPTGAGVEAIKEVWLQVVDRAGHSSAAVSDEIVFDSKAPTGGLTLSAAVTRDTLIGVDLTYDPDVTHFKLSSGGSCAGGNWVEVSAQSMFTLPSIDGTHDVSVRFRDGVLNESTCYSASVVLDRTGPLPTAFSLTGSGAPLPGYSDSADVSVAFGTAESCVAAEFAEDVGFIAVLHTEAVCNGSAAYSFANPADGFKSLYLRFIDVLGNYGPVTGQTIMVDSSVPTVGAGGGFTISEGTYVNEADITLQMQAVGATRMRVAQAGLCSGGLEAYAATRSFTLSGLDGVKTMAVRFEDEAGNATACYTRQVTLDTDVPTFAAAVTGPEGVPGRTSSQVATLTISGAPSDAVQMMISDVAGFSGASWVTMQSPVQRALQPGDGLKTLFVKLRDRAGNESSVQTPTIVLDQTPPDAVAISLTDVNGDGFPLTHLVAELAWSSSSDLSVTGYELERFVVGTDTVFQPVAFLSPGTFEYADDISETAGVVHQYRVRVHDDLGQTSQWSNVVNVYTMSADSKVCWMRNQQTNADVTYMIVPPAGATSIQGVRNYMDLATWLPAEQTLPPGQLQLSLSSDFSSLANFTFGVRAYNQDNLERTLSTFSIPHGFKLYNVSALNPNMQMAAVMDSAGYIHMVYYVGISLNLRYMNNVGGTWNTPVDLDTVGDVGSYPSIAIDTNGDLHVAYYDATNKDLKYIRKTGATWGAPQVVQSTGDVGTWAALALDASNQPYIVYQQATAGQLWYSARLAGVWAAPVTLETAAASFASVVIDGADTLHVAYKHPVSGNIMYVSAAGGVAAAPLSLDAGAGDKRYPAIKLNGAGYPYVVYQNRTSGEVRLVKFTAPTTPGAPTTVVSNGGSWEGPAMQVDAGGTIHIVYRDEPTKTLKYVKDPGAGWSSPIYLNGTAVIGGQYPVLMLDQLGHIQVLHFESTQFKHIKYVGAEFTPSQLLDSAGTVGYQPAMKQSANGDLHVVYTDITNTDVKYIRRSGGVWSSPVVIDSATSGFNISLDIDSSGELHAVYAGSGQTLVYIHTTGGVWGAAQTILAGTNYVGSPSFALDPAGKGHVVYQNGLNYDLMYVTNEGGSWSSPVNLDSAGNTGGSPEIFVAPSGDLHVSYYNSSNADLKYVRRTGTTWGAPVVVASLNNVGQQSTLGVDSEGTVHIAFWNYSYNDLNYVHNRGGQWSDIITLDSTGYVGEHASLKIDAEDVVHISYQDNTNTDLKYVRIVGGRVLTPTTIDTYNAVYTSLVLGNEGNVHVAYYDLATSDLRYKELQWTESACVSPSSTVPIGAF